MLINFTFQNWLSFHDRTEFTMRASRERQHKNHLLKSKKFKLSVLPITALYGANASGKSNFVDALIFARNYITNLKASGPKINVYPFLFTDNEDEKPECYFAFEILIDEMLYEYEFIITPEEVVEERLFRKNTRTRTVLFERKRQELTELDEKIKGEKRKFLKFISKATKPFELYLTKTIELNETLFQPLYNWFSRHLLIMSADSSAMSALTTSAIDFEDVSKFLREMDTGISEITCRQFAYREEYDVSKAEIEEELQYTCAVQISPSKFICKEGSGKLIVKEIQSVHRSLSGKRNIPMPIGHESDGTQRILELLVAFLVLMQVNPPITCVIDELDRTLHTHVTRKMLELFLDTCSPESRSQLIFTTHDVCLMDQALLRQDEMWLTDKNEQGISSLYSISDLNIRYDLDVKKYYLQGRFGGIPRILLNT